MAKTLAQIFIVLTIVFEAITLLGLTALYPLFGVVSGAIMIGVIAYHIVKRTNRRRYIQLKKRPILQA